MSVDTGGPIRGLIGGWLMRLEAAGGILRMVFLGVTAASTFTSALALIGLQQYAPYVLAAGCLGVFAFAYVYVELGFFNRKNREKVDNGNNFATPRDKIDNTTNAAGIFAALHGRPPSSEELAAIEEAIDRPWGEMRDGVEVDR